MADTPTQYHATIMIIRDHRMTASACMPGDSPEAAIQAVQGWIMSMYPTPVSALSVPLRAEASAAVQACVGVARQIDKLLSSTVFPADKMTALTIGYADKVDGVPAATAAMWINDASLSCITDKLLVPALLRALTEGV
ncbi:hypothetical protein [Tistrella mobilis]|uniref:Uncharacterized protein n=1 Tax=Tistrella mobilis (strain KA081020-065) TaxID=1110502 RepID=I3TGL8_TISMK|nr:hypothetical protein [Tistrella mobilis]AFK51906.1 hypothetical protein TMO_0067 [Tistrella mobilis KA081020-065]